MLLPSCALLKAERVAVTTTTTETLPPELIPQTGGTSAGNAASSTVAPKTVFIPGSAGGGSAGNFASDEGVSAGEIRLGTIQPMDGPAASLGRPLYYATQAYVNALNARGGIHGRRVRLFLQTACINCEAENKLAAKTLVEDKKVFAIVNTYMNTYAFSAALDYLNRKKVPLIQGWSGTGPESISWSPRQTPWNVYYTVGNPDAVKIYVRWLDEVMRNWIEAGRITDYRVGIVGLDVSQDNKRGDEFTKAWQALGGTHRVVSRQRIKAEEETVTHMNSQVARMRDDGAQGVFSASNITMVFGMQAAQTLRWKVPWLAKSAWGRAATDNCGSACEGGYTDNNGWGWPGIDTPQMRQYKDAMARYYPDSTDDAQTLGGWIGMQAFEYAASKLGAALTRGAVMDILANLTNLDTGIGSPVTTTPSSRFGMRQLMMLQVCGNKFYRVTDLLSPESSPRKLSAGCGWGYG
jgi:ABC-type branched-subunit amino acid transport system substrate-binding protein